MKFYSSLILVIVLACASSLAFALTDETAKTNASVEAFNGAKVRKTKAQWKRILPRETYIVTREAGTERPYTSALLKTKGKGTYHCASCNLALFSSATKYDSKTGWPSFYQAIAPENIIEKEDRSNEMEVRTETSCARCDAHLGHVFKDGPEPTGLRYCMNGVALKFAPERKTVARKR